MRCARQALVGLCCLLACGSLAEAQNAKKKDNPKNAPVVQLVPQSILDKLDLTAKQKEKFSDLQDEFAKQQARAKMQMLADMKKAKADDDKAGIKRAAAGYKISVEQTRTDMEPKFVEILTPAQKTKYDELKKDGTASTAAKETVEGKIKSLDPDKGTLVVTVGKQNRTFRLSRATKVVDQKGEELAGGLADKKLAPGAMVSVTVEKEGPAGRNVAVKELKLAGS
jgi:Spy/CpxP family protein refolding chaperone